MADFTIDAPDIWPAIEARMARRRRLVVLRRVSFAAVAAAACIAAGVFLFRDRTPEPAPVAPVQTASVTPSQETLPAVEEAAPANAEIEPIRQQIARFTGRDAVAQNRPARQGGTVEEPVAQMSDTAVTRADEQKADEVKAEVVKSEEIKQEETAAVVKDPAEGTLTEENLPADFWTEEPEARKSTHTSQISILSNLTTVASEGDLIHQVAPSHASSQSGSKQATSEVVPFSESPKFYSPLTLGIQVAVPLTERLYVATGVTYSYLVSQYDILINAKRYPDAYNQLHYVGIPLQASYRMVQTPSFGFYASAGAALEKCVYQRYVFEDKTLSEKVTGIQSSASIGLGAEYWFTRHAGVYFDPSLVYYFGNKQPLSIRTQQPLQARLEVGLRFRL
ncbi:MAG: hypothetical protein K6G79_01905 [Bacteroidales bacterium]|nr:hypothetical protein [Bacteroidales bacterium]